MTTEVTITSRTHGMALTSYLGSAALGVLQILGVATATQLVEWIEPLGYKLWAGSLIVAGGTGFAMCLGFPVLVLRLTQRRRPTPGDRDRCTLVGLYIEAAAALTVALACGLYEASLRADFGDGVATTQVLALTSAAGGLVRLIQIIIELHRVRRARPSTG